MSRAEDTMDGEVSQPSADARSAAPPAGARGGARAWPSTGGGLLALWSIGLLLFPIRLAKSLYDTSFPVLGLRPSGFSIGAALHLYPTHAAIFVLGMALDIGHFCVWLLLISSYVGRSSSTRRLMLTFLLLGIARNLLPAITPGAPIREHAIECASVFVLALWLPYVQLSERIRRTFVLEPISGRAKRGAIGGFLVLSIALGGLILRSLVSFDPSGFAQSPASNSNTVRIVHAVQSDRK